MSKLTKTQLTDLILLAKDRAEAAIASVDQLVDDPQQAHMVRMAVIVGLVGEAAVFLSEHTTDKDGEKPEAAVAYFKVLTSLAHCGDENALQRFVKEKG